MKVREIIKIIEDDGWIPVATKGSHRQYNLPKNQGELQSPDILQILWRQVQ